ncbi:phage holin family protein [Pseudomonas sp. FP2335]|uniref:phage holin family protein n=1 Tax=Pseudomonas sp. FP2335 TaxID=2954092 RepID=UPI00351E2131
MPSSKDPTAWAVAFAWLAQHVPVIYVTSLSALISALRIIYRSGTRKAVLLT